MSARWWSRVTPPNSEELVRGVARGLFVRRLHYVNGMLEPRRAVMTGLTRDGTFLIENGKLTRPSGTFVSPTACWKPSNAWTASPVRSA